MKHQLPLTQDKKLNVIVRVEHGCLGPDGTSHIEEFCNFAQIEVESIDADFVHWEIKPRSDKTRPEMEYKALNKKLTHAMAAKYLGVFGKSLDEFEHHIHDKLATLIEHYLGRSP